MHVITLNEDGGNISAVEVDFKSMVSVQEGILKSYMSLLTTLNSWFKKKMQIIHICAALYAVLHTV